MMQARWQRALIGIIMGVVAYVVVDELLGAFDFGESTGGELITTLVPIAIAVAVVLFAFKGIAGNGAGAGATRGGF